MDSESLNRLEIIETYRSELKDIWRYIPWLQEKEGSSAAKIYENNELSSHSMTFPVYDSTLMSLIKAFQKTSLMDRNYVYVYSRYRLRTTEDELNLIQNATVAELNAIGGILSKYVMGGMTKGRLWNEAVENGIFLQALLKMKDLLELWDKPLA